MNIIKAWLQAIWDDHQGTILGLAVLFVVLAIAL